MFFRTNGSSPSSSSPRYGQFFNEESEVRICDGWIQVLDECPENDHPQGGAPANTNPWGTCRINTQGILMVPEIYIYIYILVGG